MVLDLFNYCYKRSAHIVLTVRIISWQPLNLSVRANNDAVRDTLPRTPRSCHGFFQLPGI